MSKKDNINKLTNYLALALSHKIGSMVNSNELYANKYRKEYNNYIEMAKAIVFEENFNLYDREEIKQTLMKKLEAELRKKDFIDNKKFDLIEEEIRLVLLSLFGA